MDKFTEEETAELRRLVDEAQVSAVLGIQGLSSVEIDSGKLVETRAHLSLLNTIMEKLNARGVII